MAPKCRLDHALRRVLWESHRDSVPKPKVARNKLPWVQVEKGIQPGTGCGPSPEGGGALVTTFRSLRPSRPSHELKDPFVDLQALTRGGSGAVSSFKMKQGALREASRGPQCAQDPRPRKLHSSAPTGQSPKAQRRPGPPGLRWVTAQNGSSNPTGLWPPRVPRRNRTQPRLGLKKIYWMASPRVARRLATLIPYPKLFIDERSGPPKRSAARL